jgi:hypothetical protein
VIPEGNPAVFKLTRRQRGVQQSGPELDGPLVANNSGRRTEWHRGRIREVLRRQAEPRQDPMEVIMSRVAVRYCAY